ncbi:MAG: putative ABC transporter permease [Erysipelotrichales bacterium]|nr:putative ABC transporter permease [Erysipelotrichales bacterium]
MEYFLVISFLFIVGSTIGWVIELLFRRIFTAKRWINPGFLVGPYLPLYGFGLCGLFGLANINLSFITNIEWLQIIIMVLIMTIVMTLIEYLAGIIFIKGLNIKLWDYSNRKCNIQGIICPMFTFFWATIAAIYIIFIHDIVISWVSWFTNNIAFSFVVGIIIGAIIVDFAYSLHLATIIKRHAKETKIIIHYEKLKESFIDKLKASKVRQVFLLPLKTIGALGDSIKAYIEAQKEE